VSFPLPLSVVALALPLPVKPPLLYALVKLAVGSDSLATIKNQLFSGKDY
jgi:hypothetical protein